MSLSLSDLGYLCRNSYALAQLKKLTDLPGLSMATIDEVTQAIRAQMSFLPLTSGLYDA